MNINPNDLLNEEIIGDGNCLFRSIARFVYGTENLHYKVRKEIYNEAWKRRRLYPEITLDTENGPLPINEHINHINQDGLFGGELEISIAASIYNINIATYNAVLNSNNNLTGYTYINYYC